MLWLSNGGVCNQKHPLVLKGKRQGLNVQRSKRDGNLVLSLLIGYFEVDNSRGRICSFSYMMAHFRLDSIHVDSGCLITGYMYRAYAVGYLCCGR
jgi:hypothetical protein